MKSLYLITTCLFFSLSSICQSILNFEDSKKAILTVLEKQEKDWSKGDLNEYMHGYWKSDSLKFIGKNGIQYGWHKTLDGYKKSYADKAEMGLLKFEIISIEVFSETSAFVIGKWDLKRAKGDIGGYYTLLFKKTDGKWVIVCDHTS